MSRTFVSFPTHSLIPTLIDHSLIVYNYLIGNYQHRQL